MPFSSHQVSRASSIARFSNSYHRSSMPRACSNALKRPYAPRRPKKPATDSLAIHTLSKSLTENEFIDFSRLWHDGCVKAIIEAQDVDRNHSAKVSARGTTLRKRSNGCRMGAD